MSTDPGAALFPIRMVRVSGADVDGLARHMVDHMAESGRQGSPHFAVSTTWVYAEVRSNLIARLSKDLDEPLWGRAWSLLAPGEAAIVGHAELRGGRVHAEMHRATLGMGIMRGFTRQGHGRRLLEIVARWARDTADLAWLDLGVFASNAPARSLYGRMGFVEIGQREDAFRLGGGVVIDDVQMTLKLR